MEKGGCRHINNNVFDVLTCGVNLLITTADIDGILSIIVTAILLFTLVVRYSIVLYNALKDRKIDDSERKELDDISSEIKGLNDDLKNKKE